MALKNPNTGEYLKITSARIDEKGMHSLDFTVYQNIEHRTNGDSEYLHSKSGHFNGAQVVEQYGKTADATKSILDNLKTAGYLAIKSDNLEYSTWQDA